MTSVPECLQDVAFLSPASCLYSFCVCNVLPCRLSCLPSRFQVVTQIQHTGRADKSNLVTSDVDAYLPHTLSLCVILCQGLSIDRSSRRVTWHQAASDLAQEPSEGRAHTVRTQSHTAKEALPVLRASDRRSEGAALSPPR